MHSVMEPAVHGIPTHAPSTRLGSAPTAPSSLTCETTGACPWAQGTRHKKIRTDGGRPSIAAPLLRACPQPSVGGASLRTEGLQERDCRVARLPACGQTGSLLAMTVLRLVVIASAAKQSRPPPRQDCFVARGLAPRNDGAAFGWHCECSLACLPAGGLAPRNDGKIVIASAAKQSRPLPRQDCRVARGLAPRNDGAAFGCRCECSLACRPAGKPSQRCGRSARTCRTPEHATEGAA